MAAGNKAGVAALLFLGAVAALSSASPAAAQAQASAEPTRIAIYDDLPYRSGDNPKWVLDLAMPENFGPELRPAIVIIHGGGWNAGSKRSRPYPLTWQ